MAAIGVFDSFKVEEFDPEEADPELFRRRSSSLTAEVTQDLYSSYFCNMKEVDFS